MEPRGKFSKENILKNGSIEVHVKINGIRQRHTLRVEREKTAFGIVPYLVCDKNLPTSELLRLAEELHFPIKCKGMKVFPKGKAARDFVEAEPEKKRTLSHNRIMNDEREEEAGTEEEPDEGESGEGPADEETKKSEEAEGEETGKSEESEGDEESEDEAETQPDDEGEGEEKEERISDEEEPESGQEVKKAESIEIEGSSQNMKKNDAESSKEEKPEEKKERKKIFSGVLSEGILT